MDTIQALPLADMLPSLVPQAPQEFAGKDLKNAAFSKVFREASERTASAEVSPENVIGALAPMLSAATSDIQTPVIARGSVARGGNISPLQGLGIAAQAQLTTSVGDDAKAFANGLESGALPADRMMATSQPFSPSALASTQKLRGSVQLANAQVSSALESNAQLSNAQASNAQVSSPPASHTSVNPLNMEIAGRESSDVLPNLQGADAVDAEVPSAAAFRADTLRTIAQPTDARRARIDSSANTSEPILSSVSSVSPTAPVNATPATSPASPTYIVMQPGAPLLDSLGEKIIWLTRQDQQQATLQLRPAELGALEIRVSITNATSARIEIHAQQSDTGDLIESMLPKLQQALEQQGLKLDDVKMSQQSLFSDARSAQQQANSRDPSAHASNAETNAETNTEVEDDSGDDALISSLPKASAIDTYA